MKFLFFILGALCLVLWAASCSKPDNVSEDTSEAEVSEVVAPTPPAPATPAPLAVAPTPPPKRLAPDGIFFLLTKKSVETDSGIVGLRPGAQVIRQPDGKFLVEGHTLDLASGEITNDLDLAARVAGADSRAQAAIRQTLAARPVSTAAPETASEPAPANSSGDSTVSTPPQRSGSSLGGSNALGAAHTRTQNGWLYQKNSEGEWEAVRRTR